MDQTHTTTTRQTANMHHPTHTIHEDQRIQKAVAYAHFSTNNVDDNVMMTTRDNDDDGWLRMVVVVFNF